MRNYIQNGKRKTEKRLLPHMLHGIYAKQEHEANADVTSEPNVRATLTLLSLPQVPPPSSTYFSTYLLKSETDKLDGD
jgi:hypothetical protein